MSPMLYESAGLWAGALIYPQAWQWRKRLSPVQVLLSTQCTTGGLHPDLYQSGAAAMEMGCEAGPSMSPECASVKLMQHLKYRDLPLGVPLAGEC